MIVSTRVTTGSPFALLTSLEEVGFPLDLEAAEVVLAMWVIFARELVERPNSYECASFRVERQFADALRHDDVAADERGPKVVVEQPNALSVGARHCGASRGAHRRKYADVLLDDGERLVEGLDVLVRKVLADEFELVFVEQRGLHYDGILAVDQRRDLDIDEL